MKWGIILTVASREEKQMSGMLLHCPIRGRLNVSDKASDELTYTEEKRRIDCIRFLLQKGYPKSHFKIETVLLRFGHQGRNSFRTDLAVLDVPVNKVSTDISDVKTHIKLVAEIKRDNKDAKVAKETQVHPALAFLPDLRAYGLYWDDIEQRLFYRTIDGTQTRTHETTAALLPNWGAAFAGTTLTSADLRPAELRELFERIEDRLHREIPDKSKRFEIMLKLLLAKLFDERTHPSAEGQLTIQDFTDMPLSDSDVRSQFATMLSSAVDYYQHYLPNPVTKTFDISGAMLRELSALIAPVRILGSRREVIQDFYMYFAKGVYRWDLAQYFTPAEVVDFIVALTNPRAGDQVKDPACGSGDFLISAFHYASKFGGDLRDAVWGTDQSPNAVQVCVLNMLLNGDGKANISEEDSLVDPDRYSDQYSVVLCNPPFGKQITERRFEVLRKFDLGHEWELSPDGARRTERVLSSQQAGILFAELCLRQVRPGGRVGIILPNGYLGNRSKQYVALREWILRHAYVLAVVGFPRFTFKRSGADVSASVLLLERREQPLQRAIDSVDYPSYFGLIESVGWSVSDKRAKKIYKRDPLTGTILTGSDNEPLLDADFNRVLQDFRSSAVKSAFPWVVDGTSESGFDEPSGYSQSFHEILAHNDLSLDPKRWCERSRATRLQITAGPHFRLGDIVEVVPTVGPPDDPSELFEYVELQDVTDGVVTPTALRGWQLPSRARHRAEPSNIFVANIWGSVSKWFIAGGDCSQLIVTNGFHRLCIKPGKGPYLLDLVAGLNTEFYRIQARALCTGSDGLAELSEEDLLQIVLPRVTDETARDALQQIVDASLAGRNTITSLVEQLREEGALPTLAVGVRSSNWVQV